MTTIAGMSPRALTIATLIGAAIGVVYTLSPLLVWFLIGCALLSRSAIRGLDADERRVVLTLLVVAITLRVLVIAALFVTTDHASVPFGSLFGDEEYFKRRSLWLRSMALDVNIAIADRIYAVDEYSDTSYLYMLAFLQTVTGSAPYGVHLFSVFLYLAGTVLLFRFIRQSYGPAPAALAFSLVLFLPTLFLWSVSALRESLHFLLVTLVIVGALRAVASVGWRDRIGWAVVATVSLALLRDLRAGSMQVLIASAVLGIVAARTIRSWRSAVLAVVVAAVVGGVIMSRPAAQHRLIDTLRAFALNHQGHVFTAGVHYRLLDPEFYAERSLTVMNGLTYRAAARYAVRAVIAAVLVPLPWQAHSTLIRAYLPEHMIWYALVVLLPIGIWIGLRHNPPATLVMTAYIVSMGLGVALRSGNIGTLVRHRSLVLPFIICLSAVAVCHLLARTVARRRAAIPAASPALEGASQ